MLTKKEVETFQKIVKKETGILLPYEVAKTQARQILELMVLLIVPENHQYDILNYDKNKWS